MLKKCLILFLLTIPLVYSQGLGHCSLGNYPLGHCSLPIVGSRGGGGGGGGSVNVPLGFTQAVLFGEEPTNNTCKQGFQMLDERCYECNPERGYLHFNDQDRSVACILCSEGFRMENKKCIDVEFKPNIYYKYVDDTAIKISNFFKTDNPTIGYIVIMSGLAILGSNILTWLMKKPNAKK